MKKLLLATVFLFLASPALAQNPQCPTRPTGDNSNACASTAFVNNTLASGIPLAENLFLVGNSSGFGAGRLIIGSDLPNPSATTLGGVFSSPATTSSVLSGISNLGAPQLLNTSGAVPPIALFCGTSTVYNICYAQDGRLAIQIGGASDPTNYYKATTHAFSSASGAVAFGDFEAAGLRLNGSTSGSLILAVPAAVGGAFTLKFPGGSTDFSATGGTSQVVKQTSLGGAFTVARLACSDLSDSSSGCSAASGITALTGDVTATGPGSVAATIANAAVSNAKLANMTNSTIKCRTTAGTGVPEDCTATQIRAITAASYILAQDATQTCHTGDLTDFTLKTISVAGNTIGINGALRVTAIWSRNAGGTSTNLINTKLAGTTFNLISMTTTGLSARTQLQLHNRGVANSQVSSGTLQSNFSSNVNAIVTTAIDTTASQDITLTGQLANTGDSVCVEAYIVEVLPKS